MHFSHAHKVQILTPAQMVHSLCTSAIRLGIAENVGQYGCNKSGFQVGMRLSASAEYIDNEEPPK